MRAAAALAFACACAGAAAAEFRAVEEPAAVLYDAPSRAAKPLYVVSRHYPLEVMVTLEAWVKVRDHTGALSWIEKKSLSERRMVVVTAPAAEVRERPQDTAPVVFGAAQSVALELLEVLAGGWLRVRHADGASGYVRAALVWGV
ncbi:MAG: SH3 domain-containing protein [Pseudomonadota bacterium]